MPRTTSHVAPRLRALAVRIAELTPDPANLKQHPERSLVAIAASLKRFGQQRPIVVDARGVTIAGAGVLEAARRLKWTHVAAVRSDLAGAERIGYAIADNRTAELSEWDQHALLLQLKEMPADLAAASGFTEAEISELGKADVDALEDDAAPAPLPKAVTRTGELWLLGKHRLLCGDSTRPADVARVMGRRRAALLATDPPYLVDYTGERPAKPGKRDGGKDWSGLYREIDIPDAERFFRDVFTAALGVLEDHAAVYCWHAHRRIAIIQRVWEELGILDHQQIIWVKPAAVLGRMYWHFQHEPCVMGWRKGSKPAHDGRHLASSVWVVPWSEKSQLQASDAADVWFCDWEGKARVVGNEHPTQKPVELFARPMRKHTAPGDVVFEPFSGSGSQLVAAEQLGRACCALELQPVFVDVAVRRWQQLTGDDAILEGTRSTWTELARRRGVTIRGIPETTGSIPETNAPIPETPAGLRSKRCPAAPSARASVPVARSSPKGGTARTTRPRRRPRAGRPPRSQPTRAATGRRGGSSGR